APLGRLGRPSTAPPAAWRATGAAVRRLHDTPPPPWPRHDRAGLRTEVDAECVWRLDHDVLPADVVRRNRHIAEAALQPFTPVFVHDDLQVDHVFVQDDAVTAVLDWSEAGAGDAHHDLATLTLGHSEHLDDVLAGYGAGVDREAVRGWWSLRSLLAIRWLAEHGFDPTAPGCEIDVLTSQT
ncbi:phosphotransferase, partial [Jatrophihabitans sp. YIM 134969]